MKPVPPFDFDLSARIFSGGDPSFRNYDGECFRLLLRIEDGLVLATIKSKGTVDEPALSVTLEGACDLSTGDVREAKQQISSIFNLEMDLKPFYRAVGKDPVMSRIAKSLYGLKSPTTPTVFEALVESIIGQQISVAAARSMSGKLIHHFGDILTLDGNAYYAFPTPERLSAANMNKLLECGLSARKAEYIKDISLLVASGRLDLDAFEGYEDIEEIREELSSVRGIGPWTAEMTMIRGLHKMDSIPADDIGLQARIAHFYRKEHKRVTSNELRKVAESWGGYRGLGGYYLIMAYHVGVEP